MQGRYLEAVLEWLGEIDAGQYEKAWSDAASFARLLESPSQWGAKMSLTRTPLGQVLSRSVRRTQWTSNLSGAPEGKYLIYVFRTEFEPGPMIETVTLMFERDGNWRVMGYSIKPDAESSPDGAAPALPEQAVVSTVETWLAGIDAGDYPRSWNEAAEFFRNAITSAAWSTALTKFRKPLGELKSRKMRDMQETDALPGAPDGKYVIIQFDSSFAAKAEAVETVTFTLEKDGSWRAAGYFIR
jgi:hypothetical protein